MVEAPKGVSESFDVVELSGSRGVAQEAQADGAVCRLG